MVTAKHSVFPKLLGLAAWDPDLRLPEGETLHDPEGELSPDGKGVVALSIPEEVDQGSRFPSLPGLDITINDEIFEAHVDTGSPLVLILPYEFINDFAFLEGPSVQGNARLAGGARSIWTGTLEGQVAVGAFVLENPKVHLMKGIPGVNVGSGRLGQGVLTMDPGQSLIEIKPAEDSEDQASKE